MSRMTIMCAVVLALLLLCLFGCAKPWFKNGDMMCREVPGGYECEKREVIR